MKNGVVTIVLPIYNVEKYLNRCIKSIVNQTYDNLEIILVDDGSPDRCPEMCDDWAKRDNRIKVIHKQNAGLGMARNTGIESASGEFICFFDSDDYVALDTIEKAYHVAKKETADIVVYGFCPVRGDGKTKTPIIPNLSQLTFQGSEIEGYFLPNLIAPDIKTGAATNLWMSAWTSLYSMDLIRRNEWSWVSERQIISEDVYSLLCLYKWVSKVAVIPEALYFYCENGGSLTHIYKADRYEKIKYFYDSCLSVCDELKYSKKIKEQLAYPYLSNTIAALKMIVLSSDSKRDKTKHIREIVSDEHLQHVLQTDFQGDSRNRKLLIWAMRKRLYIVVEALIRAKS